MATKITVEKDELVIRIPLDTPRLSSSGKTMIVASTGGFLATEAKDPSTNKTISVSVNATIKA